MTWIACDEAGDGAQPAAQAPPHQVPEHLEGSVRLRGSYQFGGRRRQVAVEIALDNVIDPYRSLSAVLDPSERLVAVRLRLLNRGRDAFPAEWARFRGYDSRGRRLRAGTQNTPLRKSLPDRPVRGQTLTSLMAFHVPDGRRLASVRMSSIVELWPFRAGWRLEQ